jgi:SAM-dependent methyltransferase
MVKNDIEKFILSIPTKTERTAAWLLQKFGYMENYHPSDFVSSNGLRSCDERSNAIIESLQEGSLCLDIGCHTGFFSNEIAKHGIFTIGIDIYLKDIITARAQYPTQNLQFVQSEIDLQTVSMLPNSDIVLLLSVFHHFVRYYGEEQAILILKKLAEKCNKQFYFETGQPNELEAKWAPLMEFMGDTETWTRDFFIDSCGFNKVTVIGEFPAFIKNHNRKLFLVER